MNTFSIGLFTDTHYSRKLPYENRYYENSLDKVKYYVQKFKEVDMVFHLGDVIDCPGDEKVALAEMKELMHELNILEKPVHYLLGNHDVESLPREQLHELFKYPKDGYYYSFDYKGVHFIIMDSNNDEYDIPYTQSTMNWLKCCLGEKQRNWLKKDLSSTKLDNVVVMVHALLIDFDDAHVLRDAEEIREILEQSGKNIMVFHGHMHWGDESSINGISYHTLEATVNEEKDCFYAILHFDGEKFKLEKYKEFL